MKHKNKIYTRMFLKVLAWSVHSLHCHAFPGPAIPTPCVHLFTAIDERTAAGSGETVEPNIVDAGSSSTGAARTAQDFMAFLENLRASGSPLRIPLRTEPAEYSLAQRLYRYRLNPAFMASLSLEAVAVFNTQSSRRSEITRSEAAQDFMAFLQQLTQNSLPLRLPLATNAAEKSLHGKIKRYYKDENFLSGLSPQARELIQNHQFERQSRAEKARKVAINLLSFLESLRSSGEDFRMPMGSLRGAENLLWQQIRKHQYEPEFIGALTPEVRALVEAQGPGRIFPSRSSQAIQSTAEEFMAFLETLRSRGEPLRLPSSSRPDESPLSQRVRNIQTNPHFLGRLSEDARQVLSQNVTPSRVEEPARAASDFMQFLSDLEGRGESLRMPSRDLQNERALYHSVQRFAEDPIFLEPLSETARELLSTPTLTAPSPAMQAAQQLNEFIRGRLERGESVRLPSSSLANEQRLYSATYRYRFHNDFVNALSAESRMVLGLEPESEIIAQNRARRGGPGRPSQAETVAQEFMVFLEGLRQAGQPLRRPLNSLTQSEEERRLYSRIYRCQAVPAFYENLSDEALDVLTDPSVVAPSRGRPAGQGARHAARDFLRFLDELRQSGQSLRRPSRTSSGEERNLAQRIYLYGHEEVFLAALTPEARNLIPVQRRGTRSNGSERTPATGPIATANEFNGFVIALQEESEIPRMPLLNVPEERNLAFRIGRYRDNPEFVNALNDQTRILFIEMQRLTAARHNRSAKHAGYDLIDFVRSLRERGEAPRLPSHIGENSLYQRMLRYRNNPNFLRVLPEDIRGLLQR